MKKTRIKVRWRVNAEAEVWTEGTSPDSKGARFVCACDRLVGRPTEAGMNRARRIAALHNAE